MSKPKNTKQIKAEIKALKTILPKLPIQNYFGESIPAKVLAEIEVLEQDLSEDDIEDRWDFHVRESALHARAWMDGDEEESPSAGWKTVASFKFR